LSPNLGPKRSLSRICRSAEVCRSGTHAEVRR
jgi:hypothetical protein